MIVKIVFVAQDSQTLKIERVVECDSLQHTLTKESLELWFYKNNNLIEEMGFNDLSGGVDVFIMEGGRTIDRIIFPPITTKVAK